MKKICCVIILLSAMQQLVHGQQTLKGTYKVDLAKTVSLMEGDNKQKYDDLDSSVKERAKQSMDGRVFIFKDGGQLEVRWNANGSEKFTEGTWQMKDQENLLIKIGDQVTEYQVSRPTATGLVLRNESGRGFFSNLYLESSE